LSGTETLTIQWNGMFVLFTLILVATALVPIERPAAMGTALVIFSNPMASCLTLLGR